MKVDSENSAAEASSTRVETEEVNETDEETGASTSSKSQSSTPSTTHRHISPLGAWASKAHFIIQPQLAAHVPTDPRQQYTPLQYPSHGNWRGGPLGTDLAPLDVPHLYDQLRPMKIPMDPEIFAQYPEIKPDYHNHLLLEKMWRREVEHAATVKNLRMKHQERVTLSGVQAKRISELEMRVQQFDGTLRLKDTALAVSLNLPHPPDVTTSPKQKHAVLTRSPKNFETRKNAHEKLIKGQDKKIADLEAERANDKAAIKQLQKRIEKLKAKDTNKTELTKNQEIALAKKDILFKKVAQRNLELAARLDMLEENPLTHEKVIAVLEEKDAEIAAIKAVVTEHEETIASLKEKSYKMDKVIQDNKDAKITAANETAQRESAIRKLEKENAALKQEKRTLSTNCEILRVENDRLKKHKCPPAKKEAAAQVNKQVIADNVSGSVVLIAGGDIYHQTVILGGKMIKGAANMIEGLVQGGRRFGACCTLVLVLVLVWYFVLSKN